MGLRSRGFLSVFGNIRFVTLVFVLFNLSIWNVSAHRDSCNWSGSGLDSADVMDNLLPSSRVVRPLTLMCSKGRVKWAYPRGGLKINFRPRSISHKSSSEFKVCIRVEPDFSGARIYLEGHRKLHLMHAGSADSRPHQLIRCFASVRGEASLYVEAVQVEGEGHWSVDNTNNFIQGQLARKIAAFSYDIRPLSSKEYDDDFEECRPCSESEILQFFCQSEYVIRGRMTSINHNQPMESSELGIKVTKVIRNSAATNQKEASFAIGQTVTLHRPIKCGSKLGEGEFLFLGRTRLGDSVVTCAPRWQEWQRIRRKALLEDSNPCLLD